MRASLVALFLCSCGGSAQVGAYGAVSAACIAQERVIVERESTEEEDERDLAVTRAVCDAILRRIEEGAE